MDDIGEFAAAGPAEVQFPCADLAPTLAFFQGLGFRIETIFPADAPTTASLGGHGLRLRLAPGGGDPGVIRLACEGSKAGRTLVAPNGTRIELVASDPPLEVPPLRPAFHLSRAAEAAGGPGRAGMIYRDLIPDRLGGRYIASHIALPDGGPVADWVHYHRVRFQVLVCIRGWARLVYEDQGPPFLFEAGDCVLQPPLIRHRVLESSAGFEVVEAACPALHETFADHDMPLPNDRVASGRDFSGQRFLHSRAADGVEAPWGDTGFVARDLGVAAASGGLADVRVLRPATARDLAPMVSRSELLLGFVCNGAGALEAHGHHGLGPGDAFVIPPDDPWGLGAASADFRVLLVQAGQETGGEP
jgi:quercetin dioxygenase-like cupin family protein